MDRRGELHEERELKGRAEGDTLTLPGHPALTYTRLTAWLSDGLPPVEVAERAGIRVLVFLSPYARCVDGRLPDLKQRLEAADDLPERLGAGCLPRRKRRHVFDTATRETPVTAGQPRSLLSMTRGVPGASPCPGRGRTRSDQQKGPPGGRALSGAPGRTRTCGQPLVVPFDAPCRNRSRPACPVAVRCRCRQHCRHRRRLPVCPESAN